MIRPLPRPEWRRRDPLALNLRLGLKLEVSGSCPLGCQVQNWSLPASARAKSESHEVALSGFYPVDMSHIIMQGFYTFDMTFRRKS